MERTSHGVLAWVDEWWMFLLILFGLLFVSFLVFFPTETENTNIHGSPVGTPSGTDRPH
jgi:hypothetical protein